MKDPIKKYVEEKGIPKRQDKFERFEENIDFLSRQLDSFRTGIHEFGNQLDTIKLQLIALKEAHARELKARLLPSRPFGREADRHMRALKNALQYRPPVRR